MIGCRITTVAARETQCCFVSAIRSSHRWWVKLKLKLFQLLKLQLKLS